MSPAVRAIVVALAGFGVLLAFVPAWAVEDVLVFAALYALLAALVDPEIRSLFRRARAKSPAGRRAAT